MVTMEFFLFVYNSCRISLPTRILPFIVTPIVEDAQKLPQKKSMKH